MRSPTLLPIRMNAAETSASSAIADCTPLTVVSRSWTTAEIDTFMIDVSTTSTNIAIARSSARRRSPGASADASHVGIAHLQGSPGSERRRDERQLDRRLDRRDLALGEYDLFPLRCLVRDLRQQMADHVEAGALLVVGVGDVPRRPRGSRSRRSSRRGRARSRPTCVREQVEVGELPDLRGSSIRLSSRRVCSSGLTSSQYFSRMMPASTIAFSTAGTMLEEPRDLLVGAETHDPLDAGAVVPAAVEDHDLATRREVRQVALDVHLRLLALGRRRERHDAEHTGLTRSVIALIVPPLPAVSRPSKTMQIFAPTSSPTPASATSSPCSLRSSRWYSFSFILRGVSPVSCSCSCSSRPPPDRASLVGLVLAGQLDGLVDPDDGGRDERQGDDDDPLAAGEALGVEEPLRAC